MAETIGGMGPGPTRALNVESPVPSEERFAVVRKMLESCGWTLARTKGSHHTFAKPGARPVIIPVHHNKVKPFYVQEVKRICRGQDD